MGVIAEYIQKKLEEDIRQKGLIVWLDKKGEFSGLVDEWIERYKDGKFPYPIFAFRGSYLELLVQSRQVLALKDMPKCVIHMPGFNDQEIKSTPLYEAYKAGQRWRISLSTVIQEAAKGRCTPDRLDSLLADENLDLASAEEFFRSQEDAPPEIRQLVNRYGEDGLVLHFITNPTGIAREIGPDLLSSFALLRGQFLRLIGLDEVWQKDWNTHSADYLRPEDEADLVVSYLLCLEFAGDLTIDAPGERLRRLQQKSESYRKKATELMQKLRRNNPDTYTKYADQVEANLTESETSLQPSDLGRLDTFRFEADIIVREALQLLAAQNWKPALQLAQTRLPGHAEASSAQTFWLNQDRQRLWLWEWIESAATLGFGIQKHPGLAAQAKGMALVDLARSYSESGWELDRFHRRFAIQTERYNAVSTPLYFKSFVEVRTSLNRLYRAAIDSQARSWNETCEATGFLGPEESRQRAFFDQRVRPHLAAGRKTALIFVDALRYELGKDLADILSAEDVGTLSIDPMLAELPTITAVGMNALIPMGAGAFLEPILDPKAASIVGFKTGQRQVIDPESRLRTLQENAGVESAWISLDSFLKDDEKQTRKYTNKQLLVVTALDIDAMGESGALTFGIDYFEKGLGRIKTALRKLKDAGFEAMVITTDHGFLLGDDSLETGRAGRLPNADRRYAIGQARNGDTLVSVAFTNLKYTYEAEDLSLMFERSTHILNTRSAGSFYHGGNSAQERVIPVITITSARASQKETGSYTVRIEKISPFLGHQRLRATVSCVNGEHELFAKETLELRMLAQDGVELNIGDAQNASVTGDLVELPIDTACEIYFKLRGSVTKAQVRFEPTQNGNLLVESLSDEYFDVELPPYSSSTDSVEATALASPPTIFSSSIPEEYYPALHHLQKHGSLSEKFLVNTLGNDGTAPRKARKFMLNISEWKEYLPFDVKSEQTPEGKEYRKC